MELKEYKKEKKKGGTVITTKERGELSRRKLFLSCVGKKKSNLLV
jgi:hypothetical protein